MSSILTNTNPNYLISIFGVDEQGRKIGGNTPLQGILSPIPETFGIGTSSSWHPLLDGILHSIAHSFIGGTSLGAAGIAAMETGARAFGVSLSGPLLTQLLWESTSPVIFNLPLKFNAISDANDDVTLPILELLKLTLPSSGTTFLGLTSNQTINDLLPLSAPGPALIGNKYNVSIAIGNMFIFDNVIVRSVHAEFSTLSVDGGDFISADVMVEVSTSRILTKSNLDDVFKRRGQFRSYTNSQPSGKFDNVPTSQTSVPQATPDNLPAIPTPIPLSSPEPATVPNNTTTPANSATPSTTPTTPSTGSNSNINNVPTIVVYPDK